MQTFKLITLLVLNSLWLPAIAQVEREPISCPLKLPKTEQVLKTVPSGFIVMTATPLPAHELAGMMINYGPPTHSDVTMYDDYTSIDTQGQSKDTATWKLAGIQDPYVVCVYQATSQVLFRSLAGYQQCVVEYRGPVNTELKIVSAVCK